MPRYSTVEGFGELVDLPDVLDATTGWVQSLFSDAPKTGAAISDAVNGDVQARTSLAEKALDQQRLLSTGQIRVAQDSLDVDRQQTGVGVRALAASATAPSQPIRRRATAQEVKQAQARVAMRAKIRAETKTDYQIVKKTTSATIGEAAGEAAIGNEAAVNDMLPIVEAQLQQLRVAGEAWFEATEMWSREVSSLHFLQKSASAASHETGTEWARKAMQAQAPYAQHLPKLQDKVEDILSDADTSALGDDLDDFAPFNASKQRLIELNEKYKGVASTIEASVSGLQADLNAEAGVDPRGERLKKAVLIGGGALLILALLR